LGGGKGKHKRGSVLAAYFETKKITGTCRRDWGAMGVPTAGAQNRKKIKLTNTWFPGQSHTPPTRVAVLGHVHTPPTLVEMSGHTQTLLTCFFFGA
jgi:hypothetical protein